MLKSGRKEIRSKLEKKNYEGKLGQVRQGSETQLCVPSWGGHFWLHVRERVEDLKINSFKIFFTYAPWYLYPTQSWRLQMLQNVPSDTEDHAFILFLMTYVHFRSIALEWKVSKIILLQEQVLSYSEKLLVLAKYM